VLLAIALALSAGIGAVIGWGRVRNVEVPRPARWEDAPVVCSGPGVDSTALEEAVAWWRELGHDLQVSCDGWTVSIDVDPTLDTRGSVEDLSTTHGSTHVWTQDSVVAAAEIRIRPGVGALAIAHELGHALGYQHPAAAPSGHILHPSRPGWDGRGLGR